MKFDYAKKFAERRRVFYRNFCQIQEMYALPVIFLLMPIASSYQYSSSPPVNEADLEVSTPVCRTRYLLATCKPSKHCSTGKMCMDTTYKPCCQQPTSECPTTVQLGFQCYASTPTNWCRQNDDCHGKKCCPTGCNYNICI
ncbi:WAP domain-containing protein [Trichostrongylus colubriformis]|uniref:WAP domain-containing protein n=1 Tax=Trichostrongylus colubriformis TaxID=6319 RepID=A0AAN8G7V7_TRICO